MILVRWRRVDDSGAWTPLLAAPSENRGFTELGRYAIEMPGPAWVFLVDDEVLSSDPENGGCWRWQPGFFAGEVTATLKDPNGDVVGLYLLDVSPDPTKVGRDLFRQMVDEIWDEDPELVLGCEPATVNSGELGETQNPWVEFARLRRYVPQFLSALAPISARPRRALRVKRTSVPIHHARRVDRRTAVSVARSSAVALFAPNADDASVVASDTRLDVPMVEDTVDAAANRAMLSLLRSVLRRTVSLSERLQLLVDRESMSETRTAIGTRWPERRRVLANFTSQLQTMLRRSPFNHVQRAEVTAAGLTAIAADPLYARAWGRGWRALRHGLQSDDRTERLWISPSWEIYERWCYVRLGKLLIAAAPGWNWLRAKAPERWVGAWGGMEAQLRLQPTFRSRESEGPGMWSVSRERVPDLVLTIESNEGVRFVVLDAKYRTSRASVLDAMASAHIYQDSLRIAAHRPEASLLLVPSGGGATWLESPDFQRTHHVGINPFSPDGIAELPIAVNQLISES